MVHWITTVTVALKLVVVARIAFPMINGEQVISTILASLPVELSDFPNALEWDFVFALLTDPVD